MRVNHIQEIPYSTNITVDWTGHNKARLTLEGDVYTLSFVDPPHPRTLLLQISHRDGIIRTIHSYPTSVRWPGGAPAKIEHMWDNVDIIVFYFDGKNYFGGLPLMAFDDQL